MDTQFAVAPPIATQLAPDNRIARLREMYWDKTHLGAVKFAPIAGCGEDTLAGHARDFATLLEISEPFIQPHELIVGSCLAVPEDPESLNLGYYNSHYPPGFETILQLGFTGIRDEARRQLREQADAERLKSELLVEINRQKHLQAAEGKILHRFYYAGGKNAVMGRHGYNVPLNVAPFLLYQFAG